MVKFEPGWASPLVFITLDINSCRLKFAVLSVVIYIIYICFTFGFSVLDVLHSACFFGLRITGSDDTGQFFCLFVCLFFFNYSFETGGRWEEAG